MNYTYIVECGDGSLYTGWTNNLEKRIQAHNAVKHMKRKEKLQLIENRAEIFNI